MRACSLTRGTGVVRCLSRQLWLWQGPREAHGTTTLPGIAALTRLGAGHRLPGLRLARTASALPGVVQSHPA